MITAFFVLSLSNINLEKTPKSIRSGIHGWADALNVMRSAWKSFRYSSIRLNNHKLNLSFIPKYLISENVDPIDQIKSSKDSKSLLENAYHWKNNTVQLFDHKNRKRIMKSTESLCNGKEEGNVKFICNNIGDLGLEEYGFTEEDLEETGGYVFSSVVILTVILFFFVVSLLYMISGFCICCCCCPKNNTSPSVLSIVFFALGSVGMLFGGVLITVSLLSSKNVFNLIEDLPDSVHEISNDFYDTINDVEKAILNHMTPEVKRIDSSIDGLIDNVTIIFQNIRKYINESLDYLDNNDDAVFKTLDDLTNKINSFSTNVENALDSSVCTETEKSDLTSKINPVKDYSNKISDAKKYKDNYITYKDKIEEYMDKPNEIGNEIKSLISEYTDFLDDPNIKYKKDIKEIADKWAEDGQSYIDYHDKIDDFSKYFKFFPVLCIPGVVCIIFSIVYIAGFFTKCCCSRCIACYSFFAQFTCNLFVFIFGVVTTILCFYFVMISRCFVGTLDDSFNYLIDTVIPDRNFSVLDFNISSASQGLIVDDMIYFDDIVISNEHFQVFDTLFKAKTTSSIDDALLLTKVIPFESLANSLHSTVSNIRVQIPDELNDSIDNAKTQLNKLPDSFNNMTGIKNSIDDVVNTAIDNINYIKVSDPSTVCGISEDTANKLISQIQDIKKILNSSAVNYDKAIKIIKENLMDELDRTSNNLLNVIRVFLKDLANVLKSVVLSMITTIQSVKAKPVVKMLNLCRSGFLVPLGNLFSFFSIGAHFFMIGIIVSSIMLLIRRRGMKRDSDSGNSSYEQTSSSQDSYSHNTQVIDIISVRNDPKQQSDSYSYRYNNSESSQSITHSDNISDNISDKISDEQQIQENIEIQPQMNDSVYTNENPYHNSIYLGENPYQTYRNDDSDY